MKDDLFDNHPALSTVRADAWVDAGESQEAFLPGDGVWLDIRLSTEYLLSSHCLGLAIPVTEDAVIPDLDKAVGKHMQQESPDELTCLESHVPDLIVPGTVTPAECDLIASEADQSIVG